MDELFAKIGRMTLALEQLQSRYDATVLEFSRVVSGEVDPSRIMVNLTDGSWCRVPQGERPALPATINGLPNCVVCPGSYTQPRAELLATISNLQETIKALKPESTPVPTDTANPV